MTSVPRYSQEVEGCPFPVFVYVIGCRNTLTMMASPNEDVGDVLLRFYYEKRFYYDKTITPDVPQQIATPDALRQIGMLTVTFEGNPISLRMPAIRLKGRTTRPHPILVKEPYNNFPLQQAPKETKQPNDHEQSNEWPFERFLDRLFGVKYHQL